MSSYAERLRSIELDLTPGQIVLLWLQTFREMGFLRAASKQVQGPREFIGDKVQRSIRKSMKGEQESLIDKAVQQAQREADQLYELVIEVNSGILRHVERSDPYATLLAAYMIAVVHGATNPNEMSRLREFLVRFVEDLIVFEGAAIQITQERLDGHEVLFSDVAAALQGRMDIARLIVEDFNTLANHAGNTPLDW